MKNSFKITKLIRAIKYKLKDSQVMIKKIFLIPNNFNLSKMIKLLAIIRSMLYQIINKVNIMDLLNIIIDLKDNL